MSFFYDLNKKLDGIRATPEVTHQQLNERNMSQHAKGIEKYTKPGMEKLSKLGREGASKAKMAATRKEFNQYDNDQVDESDFGPGDAGPNNNQAGPSAISPDAKNYKIPNTDQQIATSRSLDKMAGQGYSAKNFPGAGTGAWDLDARGQNKYVDRTTPGVINKIKDKLGLDMPDPAYGPKPDERERLAKRYPAPAKSVDEGGEVIDGVYKLAIEPKRPEEEENKMTRGTRPAPKGEFMGTIKGGVWTADPPKPGEKGVPVPKNHERVPESGKKLNFADKIANAKKEVDEMLGDVAAEAMRSALSPKQKKMAALGGDPKRIDARDLAALRKGADMGEDNAFDYKTPRSMNKGEKKTSSTGGEIYQKDNKTVVHTAGRHYGGGDEPNPNKVKRTKAGRPENTNKQPERVTANATKHKGGRKVKEGEVDIRDQGEYDQEGDMAKDDIKTIMRHAQALNKVLGDNDNLPEWVQSKLAKIEGMMISIDEYMQNQASDDDSQEPIAEKAVSKQQQRFMGMAHAMQKGEKVKGASKELKKVASTMKPKDTEDFAKTKHKGLPNKKKKEVDENSEDGRLTVKQTGPGQTSTSSSTGRINATIDNGKMSVKPAKSGGTSYGKGIYDSMNHELEQMIAESMNISMSDSTEGSKSLTITATDEDAMKLAMILKSAGLGGGDAHGSDMHSHGEEPCETCGMPDCGCGDVQEAVDENSPDYPTNTEQADNNFGYAGGLNKPKTDVAGDGQTTIPNTAVHTQDEDALRRMMEMAGIKTEVDLGPTSPDIARMSKDEVNAALRSGMNSKVDLGPTSPDIASMSKDEVDAALRSGMSPDISDMDSDSVNAEFGKDDRQYEDSMQRMREMAGIKEAKKDIDQNNDGKNDFEDIKIARMKASGAIKDKEEKKVDESIFALTNQWKAYKG